jgi:hypothetical protein
MLNAAQKLYQEIIGEPVVRGYKAPHAYGPTPPRPLRGPAPTEWLFNKDGTAVAKRRLFKGHRP